MSERQPQGAEMFNAQRIRRGTVGAALLIAACQSSTDRSPTEPRVGPVVQSTDQLRLTASPLDVSCQVPGSTIAAGPSVTVTDASGAPRAGIQVSFKVTAGGGSVAAAVATTSNGGVASAGAWRLGVNSGYNSVAASLTSGATVTFNATAREPAKVVAVYSLRTIGGQSLPLTYSGGGTSWTIVGGHYYLGDDGTYEFAYEYTPVEPPVTICSSARYVQTASTIAFYLAPGSYPMSTFYQELGGLFATAAVDATGMSVTYEDFVDFDHEVYARP
jgi:hypothetical protein